MKSPRELLNQIVAAAQILTPIVWLFLLWPVELPEQWSVSAVLTALGFCAGCFLLVAAGLLGLLASMRKGHSIRSAATVNRFCAVLWGVMLLYTMWGTVGTGQPLEIVLLVFIAPQCLAVVLCGVAGWAVVRA